MTYVLLEQGSSASTCVIYYSIAQMARIIHNKYRAVSEGNSSYLLYMSSVGKLHRALGKIEEVLISAWFFSQSVRTQLAAAAPLSALTAQPPLLVSFPLPCPLHINGLKETGGVLSIKAGPLPLSHRHFKTSGTSFELSRWYSDSSTLSRKAGFSV